MSADRETLDVYAMRAADYAALTAGKTPFPALADFIGAMPPGGRVLDLGCGPGTASAFMREAGLRPDPVDASPEMIAIAREVHGLDARVGTFDEVSGVAGYAGVWANFSLLHAPREALPGHFSAIARSLVPGGLLHVGMKTGEGARRDGLGRLYTFVTVAELEGLLDAAGFDVIATKEGAEKGLAGTVDPFVLMRGARRGG